MRSGKFFLILGMILTTCTVARADEILVSASAIFEKPGDGAGQFMFSTSFLYNLETIIPLVPGTMHINIVDTLSGTAITDFVPEPNFHGPTFTYVHSSNGSANDEIQLLFAFPGGTPTFPTPGSYPITDIMLLCVSNDCIQHFNAETLFPVAGDVSISDTPEPRPGLLFIFGALATIGLLATRSETFRKICR